MRIKPNKIDTDKISKWIPVCSSCCDWRDKSKKTQAISIYSKTDCAFLGCGNYAVFNLQWEA